MWLALFLACAPHPAPPAPPPPSTPMGPEAAPAVQPGWRSSTVSRLALDADDPAIGPTDARFTMVAFTDYFCPHCAAFWPTIVAYADAHPDVRVVFKDWPIDKACNPIVEGDRHVFACLAARAAHCAAEQSAWRPMAELLFAHPEHVTPPELPSFATEIGIDPTAFSACVDAPATAAAVSADVLAGLDANVGGTPTVFVFGVEAGHWVELPPSMTLISGVLDTVRRGGRLPPG